MKRVRKHDRNRSRIWMGVLSGAAGTAAMDLVLFARYKRSGGTAHFLGWESSETAQTWDEASAPGQFGRRLVASLTGYQLPDSWARTMVNAVHWSTGLTWGALFGVVATRSGSKVSVTGPLLGGTAWLTSYAVLPATGLYQPIWKYDARTLEQDLSVHLTFGTVTALASKLLSRAVENA